MAERIWENCRKYLQFSRICDILTNGSSKDAGVSEWQTRQTQNLLRGILSALAKPLIYRRFQNFISAFGFNIPPAHPSKI